MDISSWSRDNNVPVLTQGRNRNMQVKIDVPPREQNVPLQEEFWSGQLFLTPADLGSGTNVRAWCVPRRNLCVNSVIFGGAGQGLDTTLSVPLREPRVH